MKMKNANFLTCDIVDCFFQNTYLPGASFEASQFRNTLFHNTNLEKASFCKASGYNIDPTLNNIKKAKFSVPDVLNLLNGFEIEIEGDK